MNANDDIFDKEYKLFEDRFRGSTALIRQRLSVYLPLIAGINASLENGRKALDLGSGRGEWLGLISENGWSVAGVEPNSIAEAGQNIDAEIVQSDALAYLQQCRDRSFALVTAFHVVEHLETNYLLHMLREIRRVLTPGGLLILETPNPENLTVGWSFYVDPTHKSPIPPVLLQYHAEAAGFPAPEIVRLNGYEGDYDLGPLSAVLSVLFRSGPDYAVVARAPGANDESFVLQIRNFAIHNSQHNPTDIRALVELTRTSDAVLANHTKLIADLNEKYLTLQSALDQKTRELAAVYGSSSWRFSRPLRMLAPIIRSLIPTLRYIVRLGLVEVQLKLRKHPKLKTNSMASLSRIPPLKRRFVKFAESDAPSPPVWSIDVDPQMLTDWKTITRWL